MQARRPTAGGPYTPVIISSKPSARPGWLDVTVSLVPGTHVIVNVPSENFSAETVAAIIAATPHLYRPAGLTSNLYGVDS